MNTKIIELTEENQAEYIDQVADLEIRVLDNMEQNGKIGQLFITGKEDILEYIKSKENMVIVAVNSENKVISATYITQGQKPFTYNDITKYFKTGEQYEEYVKTLYDNTTKYQIDMLDAYKLKLQAFDYAKNKMLSEHPEFKNISEYLEHELNSNNGFDEKNELRDGINKYMSEYIQNKAIETGDKSLITKYDNFYWTTCDDIFEELNSDLSKVQLEKDNIKEYENFLSKEHLQIHSSNVKDTSVYFTADTSNSIEIDTYLTAPNNRHYGLARVLVFEGLKKKLKENFENTDNTEIFLCSTLHQDNLSSKYVSEFFDLKDNLFVRRRSGRDREVHICEIPKENYLEYLDKIEDKLIVLYGYNPTGKQLTDERKTQILKEQLDYEISEYCRLNKIRYSSKNYTGRISLQDTLSKNIKIKNLKNRLKILTSRNSEIERGDDR